MKKSPSKVRCPDRLLKKPEAAERLGLGLRTLEEMMASRAIAFVRVGKRSVRFRESSIESYIAKHEVKPVEID